MMTMSYDPLKGPDPVEWEALDESERIALVLAYHEAVDSDLPNEMIHASIHVTVENQVALGEDTPVEYEGGVTGSNPNIGSAPTTNWRDEWKSTGSSLIPNDYAPANICVISPSTPNCCGGPESKAAACGI